MRLSIITAAVCLSLAAGLGCAHNQENTPGSPTSASGTPSMPAAAQPAADADAFKASYPAAAGELCAWAKKNAEAAQRFQQFATANPDKAKEFITWSVTHVEAADAFAASHAGWSDFVFADNKHLAAANSWLNWARKYPQAARELPSRPGALSSTGC